MKRTARWIKNHPNETAFYLVCFALGVQTQRARNMSKVLKDWRVYETTLVEAVKEGATISIKEDIFTHKEFLDIAR